MVAADDRTPVIFSVSAGQSHDAPEGRKLLQRLGPQPGSPSMVMDRAYEGDATRQLASGLGYSVVIPPRRGHKVAWEYDKELYKRRNEGEDSESTIRATNLAAVSDRLSILALSSSLSLMPQVGVPSCLRILSSVRRRPTFGPGLEQQPR